MNHIWTDKEINNAVKRLQKYRSCKHGLVVKHIKSGNISAQDWRNLMFMLVERGHAFDNGENHETDNYQISINWDKQNKIFKPFFGVAELMYDMAIESKKHYSK
jgi:hypothetical protein